MKQFIAKFSNWFTGLAFRRKPALPIPAALTTPSPKTASSSRHNAPESSEAVEIPATKARWFIRLTHALRRRRKEAAPEQALDPDQSVIIKRPTQDQLEATEVLEELPSVKPSLLSRLRNKIRKQAPPELPETIPSASDTRERSRARESTADDKLGETKADGEEAPTIGFFKRLLAKLRNKWVWIPLASAMLLSLTGGLLWIVLHTAQEKEKLQAELQATKKQLKKQAVVVTKTTAVEAPPPPQEAPINAAIAGQVSTKSALGISPGDCLITDKESVTKNLKDCIESFNNVASVSRRAEKKP